MLVAFCIDMVSERVGIHMGIPKYSSNRRLSWDEIVDEFPDVVNQIIQEDQWSQFEQKPDLSEVDRSLMEWIPMKVREGLEDDRIDGMMMTK